MTGLFLILRARSAYLSVPSVSSVLLSAGLMHAIIRVWLLPPSESTHTDTQTDIYTQVSPLCYCQLGWCTQSSECDCCHPASLHTQTHTQTFTHKCLLCVTVSWADACNHQSVTVATQRVYTQIQTYKHTDTHLHIATNPAMSHKPESWLLKTLLEHNSGLLSYMLYILSRYSTDALGCMGHCSLHIHQPRQTIQSNTTFQGGEFCWFISTNVTYNKKTKYSKMCDAGSFVGMFSKSWLHVSVCRFTPPWMTQNFIFTLWHATSKVGQTRDKSVNCCTHVRCT